jgi:hypothetical protein
MQFAGDNFELSEQLRDILHHGSSEIFYLTTLTYSVWPARDKIFLPKFSIYGLFAF